MIRTIRAAIARILGIILLIFSLGRMKINWTGGNESTENHDDRPDITGVE